MKISIYNFKSIGSLVNYEMRPLTILSGTNSSGKSSFLQLLLLLKQTIEIDSAQTPLELRGRLIKIRKYIDILKGKNPANKLKIELLFNKSELSKYKAFQEFSLYEAFEDYNLQIAVVFDFISNKVIVSSFEITFKTDSITNFIRFENNSEIFDIKTDVAVFNDDLYTKQGDYKIKKINFSAFIPSDFEIEFTDGSTTKSVPKLEGIKSVIKDVFSKLNYIGPLRQEPKDEYGVNGNESSVGIDGGNVAEVLCELSEKSISYFTVEENDESINLVKKSETFINAVRYWLCEKLKLCADVYSKKEADSYVIYLKSFAGVESTIKHVGFGVSQVLPILVEGLRLKEGETLILEQPEIHLHPKIQSKLSDFLISLIQNGKKVVIETHSDHLITRVRRRIAEDSTNMLDNKVLLTFIEVSVKDVLFRNIDIDDLGNLDYFPEDFIEKPDVEFKSILKAQMKKRLKQLEK
ncbi:MAG: AAA family ATPase [Sediminibacterium sp.]|nr:AAA family ATPase [Sediminibacterium sp.]